MIHTATAIDLTLLEPILERYHGCRRDMLLPLLHEAQAIYGWLPREFLKSIGETLQVPLADVHGVVEFYTMFYNEPVSSHVVRICEDPACQLAGCSEVMAAVERKLGLKPGQTAGDGSVTYEHVTCLGMCEHAPAALIDDRPAGQLTAAQVGDFLSEDYPEPVANVYGGIRSMTKRVGVVDPYSLADYERHGGFEVLRGVVAKSPEDVIAAIQDSGIVGRGGAMFPLAAKWRYTRDAPGESRGKHIVVNGDESEPGTFKDRCLMEEDPFAVVEAAIIAGYAVGAERGWIFVRGEYPRSYNRLQHAVRQARDGGFLGRNILGRPGFNFDLELRMGAGAYICGEETALFEAIEGRRGFPRIKPPFPVTQGLFDQPTAINNVETLVAALAYLEMGIGQWRELGTEKSPGTKLFCLSGQVARPGLYEAPFGLSIRELLDMAGGVADGKDMQAILMGGAAGVFITPEELDVKITYEDLRAKQIPLGSGVLMVFDETADLREVLFQLSRFFAHESCGKCFPCQLGTQRQMEILDRIAHNGSAKSGDGQALLDIGQTMTQTSLCGLGQTAASAVMSALARWPELAERDLR